MSFRTVLLVALALVSGGSAAIGISSFLNQDAPTPKRDTATVLVAAADLPRGTILTEACIMSKECLESQTDAVTKKEDLLDRTVSTPVFEGIPILEKNLAPRGSGRGLAALIPKGMRAISIQTPSVASAGGGFIIPRSRVDVLMTPNNAGNDSLAGTATVVLQNVEVWAVGPRVEAPADNKIDIKEVREVTLLVTPDQAKSLALVQTKGLLHLTLRNPEDTSMVAQRRDQDKEEQKPPEGPKTPEIIKEPEPVQIRTLHGTQESAVLVKVPGR